MRLAQCHTEEPTNASAPTVYYKPCAKRVISRAKRGNGFATARAFLGGFAAAIQAKIRTDFGSSIRSTGRESGPGGRAAAFIDIYAIRGGRCAVTANGWDGSLPQSPPGDFLMAVDTNMAATRANVFVEQELSHDVRLGLKHKAD